LWLDRRPAAVDAEPQTMIRLGAVYVLAGLLFAAIAVASARDKTNPRRVRNAVFWGLLAVSFLFGRRLGDLGNGILVLALVAAGGIGRLGMGGGAATTPEERRYSATRYGNRLFLPALVIPATALAGTLALKRIAIGGAPLIEAGQATLISLALGVVIALSATMIWLRPPLGAPVQEGRRLLDSVGWAAILPQMLAAPGGGIRAGGRRQRGRTSADGAHAARQPLRRGRDLYGRHGLFTMVMGQRLRRLSGDDGGDRDCRCWYTGSAAIRPSSRRSGCCRDSAAR